MKKTALAITGDLTIYTAAEHREKLLDTVRKEEHCVLNISGVSEIDAAGLQVLMIAKLEAQRLEHVLEFVNHSDPVISVIDLCNLSALFGDPLVLSDAARERA